MQILSRELSRPLSAAERTERLEAVRRGVLRESGRITTGNFRHIETADLTLLLSLYDRTFFAGRLQHLTAGRLSLRLSRRLTSAAGKIYLRVPYSAAGRDGHVHFEIAISTHLLFHNFRAAGEPPLVNGIPCSDRLQGLQRVFEHELVHLVELLLYRRSSCRSARFRDLAQHLFGHSDVTHRLRTVRETARVEHDLRVGGTVSFTFRGEHHTGVINRITKRATVLVPHLDGQPYSDGHRYHKYYVPLATLQPA